MSPIEALAPWHEFYALLGAASATLVALLFVAASLASGVFTRSRGAASRMFLSATVVHFTSIVAVSLTVLAPIPGWKLFGCLIFCCGGFGLSYSAIAWHGAVRDGFSARIDLEDRIWYAALPAVGYVVETGSGVALFDGSLAARAALAVSMAGLLMVGIHNAWDITIWSVTRPRD